MPRSLVTGYQGYTNPGLDVVVANGATESNIIKTGGMSLCGVILPAALTSTALTFLACATADGTFVPIKSAVGGTLLSYTVAPGQYNAIDPTPFQGIPFLKLKFGSAEGGARTITCILKG